MNQTESIQHLLSTHKELTFVRLFFETFPNAELFLVGGAVRDLFLKRQMIGTDFDFVVRLLSLDELSSWFSALGDTDLVGRAFGVLKFTPTALDPSQHHPIDIALPRTEHIKPESRGGYHEFHVQTNAHLPIIDDLSRRDFTINAMAINMRTGELIDPCNGLDDLKQKTIRAVGNPEERFDEDLSRIMRAIRFAAELDFEMETATKHAIVDKVQHLQDTFSDDDSFDYVVSRETIGKELAKAFYKNPSRAVQLLLETGTLEVLFGKPKFPWNTKELTKLPLGFPTITSTLILRNFEKETIPTLLKQTGLDSLPRGTHLRMEPSDILWLLDRLETSWTEKTVTDLRASTFEKYFLNGRGLLFLKTLENLQNISTVKAIENRATQIRDRWSVEPGESIPSLLSGDDILSAGIPAGPRVRELLEKLRDEQLDGHILTREQAKDWLKKENSA